MSDKQTLLNGKLEVKKLRQAMVANNISELVDEIWAEYDLTEEDIKEIDKTLEKLEKQREETKNKFSRFNSENIDLPEHIRKMKASEKEKLDEWCETIEEKKEEVKEKISTHRDNLKSKEVQLTPQHWQDLGLYLVRAKNDIDKYAIVRRQLFEAKIVELMEIRGMSKTAAKSRAKTDIDYREYKEAKALCENMEEYMLWCKKVYDKEG